MSEPTCCMVLPGDGFDVRQCKNPVEQEGDVCANCHAAMQQYRKRSQS